MYRIENKQSAVKEIQKYLISVNEGGEIAPTGVYDVDTRAAIEAFQQKMGVSVTGSVNYQTFTLLYKNYVQNSKKEQTNNNYPHIDFPVRLGDFGENVLHINSLIFYLLEYYGYPSSNEAGSYFSSQSEDGVNILREIYMLDGAKCVDEFLYELMLLDRRSIEKAKT